MKYTNVILHQANASRRYKRYKQHRMRYVFMKKKKYVFDIKVYRMHSISFTSVPSVCRNTIFFNDYKKSSCSCNRPRQDDDNDDAVASFEYNFFYLCSITQNHTKANVFLKSKLKIECRVI